MAKIGIVFGCFIPMHMGHVKLLTQATRENEYVILGVCGYDNDRGKDFLSFEERQKLIKSHYKRYPKIITSIVDDKKIGLTGKFDKESWEIWSKELFQNAEIDPYSDNEFTWYTGDQSYIDRLSEIFPNHKFTLIERDGMSGTSIRADAKNNKDNMVYFFRDYLEKNHRI